MQLQDNEQLNLIVESAPIGICILDATTFKAELLNDKFLEIAGKPKDAIIGKWYWEPFAEARPYYEAAMTGVIQTGKAYYADEVELMLIRNGREESINVTFVYAPVKDNTGQISKIAIWVLENTLQVKSRLAMNNLNDELSAANEEIAASNIEFASINEELLASNDELQAAQATLQQFNETLKESDTRFRRLIQESPVAIFVLKGPNMIFETVNDLMFLMLGKGSEIIGKPYAVAVPELVGQPFFEILDQVFMTGETFYGYEIKGTLEKDGQPTDGYFNFIYQAIKDEAGQVTGVMCVATDVVEQVNSREVISNVNDRLNIALDAGKFGTTEVDLATGNMVCNERFKNLFGRSKDQEMTYPDMFEAMLPHYRKDIAERAKKAQAEHSLYEATYEIAWPDGSIHWIEAHGRARYDKTGKADRMVGILADVTEQHLAAKMIEDSEKHFRYLADLVPAKISNALPSGEVTFFNKQWLDYAGMNFEDLRDFGYHAMMHPDEIPGFVEKLGEAAAKGMALESEMRFKDVDGNYRWHLNIASPILNEKGEITMWVGSTTDIQRIKEEDQRKNDFIGMVSHELKTPLTSLSAYIQMLQSRAQKTGDTFTLGALDQSVKQVKRMTTMINGFLNVSRLESGKIAIDKQRFDMAELIKESEAETIPMYSSHQIVFAPMKKTMVTADRDKIGQVINNFISNAVKYSKLGSTIHVDCVIADHAAIVSVQDQGIGIEPQELNKLFDRYYRVEANNNISGFGIGLYLCKEIIDQHQGKIWVKSEPGKGSTFFFSIPIEVE